MAFAGRAARVAATGALAQDVRAASRWPALDGIRGVALLAVIGYHGLRLTVLPLRTGAGDPINPLWWPAGTLRFGLDAFFVLSGFLVVGSWTALRRRHGRLLPAAREYALRRAGRILPAYWVSLVVLVPLVAPHLLRSPPKLALLVAVQQYLMPGLPAEVNVVSWSLTTEAHFYMVVPVLAVLLARYAGWKVVLGALAISVVWRAWRPLGLPQSLMPGRIEQFALGAVAAGVVRGHDLGQGGRLVALLATRWTAVCLWVSLALLGLLQGAVIEGVAVGTAPLLHPGVSLVMAAWIVRLLTSPRESVLCHPVLRLMGLVSYGTYLFHFPLLVHGLRLSGSADAAAPMSLFVVLILLGLAFLAGAASYRFVERPFLRSGVSPAPAAPVIDLRDRQDQKIQQQKVQHQKIW